MAKKRGPKKCVGHRVCRRVTAKGRFASHGGKKRCFRVCRKHG